MKGDAALRAHLIKLLDWEDAHAGFEKTLANISPKDRGRQPSGLPYSPWQILEHLRRTQHDILDFCVNADYEELEWPADYWPAEAAPPSTKAWDESISRFKKDRKALQKLAGDITIDLFEHIPHGSGQTYLRELLLVADHTAYHLGQLVVLRRLLGTWE